jgi:hypothetical protein
LADVEKGDAIKIIALEETFEFLEHSKLPFPVLIKGNVTELNSATEKLESVDYKLQK